MKRDEAIINSLYHLGEAIRSVKGIDKSHFEKAIQSIYFAEQIGDDNEN